MRTLSWTLPLRPFGAGPRLWCWKIRSKSKSYLLSHPVCDGYSGSPEFSRTPLRGGNNGNVTVIFLSFIHYPTYGLDQKDIAVQPEIRGQQNKYECTGNHTSRELQSAACHKMANEEYTRSHAFHHARGVSIIGMLEQRVLMPANSLSIQP